MPPLFKKVQVMTCPIQHIFGYVFWSLDVKFKNRFRRQRNSKFICYAITYLIEASVTRYRIPFISDSFLYQTAFQLHGTLLSDTHSIGFPLQKVMCFESDTKRIRDTLRYRVTMPYRSIRYTFCSGTSFSE